MRPSSLFGASEASELLEIYSALLESAPDAMVVVDTNGAIVFVNNQTLRLFGYTQDQIIGQSVELLVPEKFREAHPAHREHYAKNPHFRAMGAGLDLSGQRRDGTEFPVEISLSPIRFKDQLLVAAAIRDATERNAAQRARHLADQRLQQIQHMEEEKQFKAQFLSVVSHELNTPVTPMKLQLHLLARKLESDDAEGAKHSLEVIKRNMDRLARLIGDILDVSRFEAGRLRIEPKTFDLGELLTHVKESFRSVKSQENPTPPPIRLILPENSDLSVLADPDRIHQVFDNLIANAVRLSPSRVDIRVQSDDDRVQIDIQDDGPGLNQEQLERLFKPFSQVHNAKRDFGGTGLGLYVCRQIAEAHGGDLIAKSPGPGKGSTFCVRLPKNGIALASSNKEAHERPAQVHERPAPKRPAAQGEQGPTLSKGRQ